ncbi:MAG: Fe-S cluster assembly protein SufD [Bacteroidia bacterium]|jgi:Fe-S cluster assembly protein SufD|nr:Fe-S cluster assembly protein SufD [Bacteroidia bacterium]
MANIVEQHTLPLDELLMQQFREQRSLITAHDLPAITSLRDKHFADFEQNGFPHNQLEKWRFSRITDLLDETFEHSLQPEDVKNKNLSEMFRCEVHNFNTEIISVLNGWYYDTNGGYHVSEEGVIVSGLRTAMKQFPDLVEKHFGTIANSEHNTFVSINTALVQDGVFIYVPDNVQVPRTLQILKLIDRTGPHFVQNRNLIVIGRNSHLSLMHCDDSINHHTSLINTVTEVLVQENASLEIYKLQNLNDNSGLVNSTFIRQLADSNVKTVALTFNGGYIRNNVQSFLDGRGAHADIMGLYLMDKEQHVDNQVRVMHNQPHCTSNELFKGILDDEATAVFNGYIYVARDAQKTNAYQNNRNILLKPTAVVDTMPFLEIYADDVKCSHGATIGQLDEDAMFYLRSRGISKANARLLLMYAFAADIVNVIEIEPLRVRIDDMVKKRLRGELSVCENCVLHCSTPEKDYHFDIDYSKI